MSPRTLQPLILLVDDSEDVREALEAFLKHRHYRVVACERYEEAIAAMRADRPDLVLTDIFLGPTSGLDLITAIRSDFAEPPPIIACSGLADVEAEALARGAKLFLLKPLVSDTLEQAMAALTGARAPGRALLVENAERSHQLRARHVEVARAARAKLEPHLAVLAAQAARDTRWLAAFLGAGDAFIATVEGDRLQVAASSNPGRWPKGHAIDDELPLCRDILETGSTFLVPDLAALCSRPISNPALPRSVAGFPFSFEGVPIGVLCLVSDRPVQLDPADFTLVGELCHRLSDWLSNNHRSRPRGGGLMLRRAIEAVIRTEFDRAARFDLAVHIFVFTSDTPPPDLFAERTLVADLGDHRFAMVMTRPASDRSPSELVAAVRRLRDLPGFERGDLLSIEARAAPRLGSQALSLLERRLDDNDAPAEPSVERIVVHLEPLEPAVG